MRTELTVEEHIREGINFVGASVTDDIDDIIGIHTMGIRETDRDTFTELYNECAYQLICDYSKDEDIRQRLYHILRRK